ncbi:MAG: hypothetical protein K8W52_38860 [Deltaproteobacteria bacterium]|nr:hypothetical protein [Deltaproteobacteria bacterium]
MQIDAEQFDRIVATVMSGRGGPYREGEPAITASEAELIVAIAQLAMAADEVEDPDEAALFDAVVARVYATARLDTAPPTLAPLADGAARLELVQTHAAQLRGTPAAALAYALAFAIVIADLELAPPESELLEALRTGLGLEEDAADEIATAVASIATPAE